MITNSQLSTTEPKKQSQETTRTETNSQKWRSHGRLLVGRGRGRMGGKGTGNKKKSRYVQNTQGEVKNSIGNEEVKEHICKAHGHEPRQGNTGG